VGGSFPAQDQGQPPYGETFSDGSGCPQKPPGAPVKGVGQAGGLWRENGLIFASKSGEPLNRQQVTANRFKPLLKRAGLPEIRFHDLRHTCATLLLSKNVNPKVVSEMLDHASIAIILDTYSHVLPTMQESAAKAMEDALS
jgi:integrase